MRNMNSQYNFRIYLRETRIRMNLSSICRVLQLNRSNILFCTNFQFTNYYTYFYRDKNRYKSSKLINYVKYFIEPHTLINFIVSDIPPK